MREPWEGEPWECLARPREAVLDRSSDGLEALAGVRGAQRWRRGAQGVTDQTVGKTTIDTLDRRQEDREAGERSDEDLRWRPFELPPPPTNTVY